MTVATRVVISYPEELSEWGRDQIDTDRYRNYLRRVVEPAEGAEFEEFVDVGCCGDSMDVPFRVESADGDEITEKTKIIYTTREATMEGGWLVQSQADRDGRCRTN
ncbi:hypothetical protein [Halolamina sediminis]|jgi:hypothetical protein|uniref:hypothetical protein n=1 Tax=Halolamina sediminis TaxID=1480675 RepID=UPI0006B6029B|nr:hypothetical protein [Halolamina sediminis]